MSVKKLLPILILLALLLFIFAACQNDKDGDDALSDYSFSRRGNEYAITSYDGTYSKITLPSEYNGLPVTSIAEYAFSGSNVSEVTLSESIKIISDNAFHRCYGLLKVFISKSVNTIGENVFTECFALTEITVDKDNVKFKSVDGNLYDKEGKVLLYYAIGKYQDTFALPQSVETIDEKAFYKAHALKTVVLPAQLKKINKMAFASSSIEKFEVDAQNAVFTADEDGLLYADDGKTLFCHPASKEPQEEYTLPQNITVISEYAFASVKLKKLVTQNGLIEIKEGAFYDSGLEEIFFSFTVTKLGKAIFENCVSLFNIDVDDNNANYQDIVGNLYNKAGDTLIAYAPAKTEVFFRVNEGIVEIADYAFFAANNLNEIELPFTLLKIGEYSLYADVSEIVFYSDTPPAIRQTSMSKSSVRIYVPDGKSELYKTFNAAWKEFENHIYDFSEK